MHNSPPSASTVAKLAQEVRSAPGAFLSAFVVAGIRASDPTSQVMLTFARDEDTRLQIEDMVLEIADEIRAQRAKAK